MKRKLTRKIDENDISQSTLGIIGDTNSTNTIVDFNPFVRFKVLQVIGSYYKDI